MSIVYLGVDVCKDVLDVDWAQRPQVENDRAPVARLVRKIAKAKNKVHFVCEATGGYERTLVEQCHRFGVPVSVVNAKRVRDFANAAGLKAKTDAIDKQLITRYAQALPPRAVPVPEASVVALRELIKRREQVVEHIAQTNQATTSMQLRIVRQGVKRLIQTLKRELAALDQEISRLVAQCDAMREKVTRLTAIVGIGETTAVTLLVTMPELGQVNRREIAALAGLAPFNRDSGSKQGKRFIRAGRSKPRRALFMPALVAKVHCPKMSVRYERMLSKNKPAKVALTAIMRQLLVTANAIMRQYYQEYPDAA